MQTTIRSILIALVTLLASPLYAAEWTDFPLAAGARAIYVSSSEGNDANDGLSPSSPKGTLTGAQGGYAAVRTGVGDHLYLKRGDTFSEALLLWTKSGLSSAYPAVLGAYGTGARPIIDRGTQYGMQITPRNGPTVQYLAITGIHFRAAVRDFSRPGYTFDAGTPGIFMAAGSSTGYPIVEDLLIEDCKFEFLGGGVSMVGNQLGSIRNVRINRNVFADIYVSGGHTNAVYASNVTGLRLEENVIDGVQRTAIAAGVPGVTDVGFSHSVYVQSDSREVVLEQNIMANAFDGGMMRPGGRYAGNLAFQVNIGTHQGYMFSNSAPIISEGVECAVVGNAFLGAWQYGLQAGNIRQGFAVDNLMLSSGRPYSVGFNLIGRRDQTMPPQVGVHNLTLFDNFVIGTEALTAAGPEFKNVAVRQNQFRAPGRIITHIDYEAGDFTYTDNRYHSDSVANAAWFRVLTTNYYDLPSWRSFINEPGAVEVDGIDAAGVPSVASYHASIGGAASEAAFLAAARAQSRQNWDTRYTAFPVIHYLQRRLGLLTSAKRRAVGIE